MWICPKCKESIEDQFDSCWKCAGDAPELALPSEDESRKKLRRMLVIRFLSLELGPMFGAIALSALSQRLMPLWFAAAAVAILGFLALSIRDGVIIREYGLILERKKESRWFWAWIVMHIIVGIFFLAAAAIILYVTKNLSVNRVS